MSSGLFFLNQEDFEVRNGAKGSTLCVTIDGYSLVLYYSTKCAHCQKLIPIFKRLPGSVGGCTFAMTNVSQNKGIVRMAKTTKAPISYVPYIVLHINGEPFMRYDGPHDFESLKRFVVEIAQKVSQATPAEDTKQASQVAQQRQVQQATEPQQHHANTIGVPKNSGPRGQLQYQAFDGAYQGSR